MWFQTQWIQRSGPAVSFGCQAAIVAFFVVSIIATQKFGEKWRVKFPPPNSSRSY